MEDTDNTFRLAIGVFDEPQELARALAELHVINLTSRELCLAGTRQAFERLKQTAAPITSRNTALFAGQLQPLLPMIENCEVVATKGDFLRHLLEHDQPDTHANRVAVPSRLPKLCGSVVDELRDGAIALLVSASNSNLLRQSSKILLRHSSHAVQTHEFAPRPLRAP